ncbi:E3 ubiquitin-protein ligase RNF181 [Colletotrichum siamense]|nr:E3 ubiquitin-protein ligase RNF181 [Colletotrichum siamense]
MSPTGTPDAASSQSSEAWEPSKQPGAVAAALCVAFALLIGLGLYMFAWKKVNIHRRPFLPTSMPQSMPQNQYRTPVSIPLTRSRTIHQPTRPPLAKLAHSKLDAAAQLATATTCSVCLEDFAAGTVVAQLPCGHVFCSECIEPWLMKHAVTCPLCRAHLKSDLRH